MTQYINQKIESNQTIRSEISELAKSPIQFELEN